MATQDQDVELLKGDSLANMAKIESNSVHLVLTDPPYNLGQFMQNRDTNMSALRSNHFVGKGWDHDDQETWEVHMREFFKESARVLVKGGSLIVFMAVIKVETLIRLAQEAGFYYKTTGTWHKKNPMPRNMNIQFINSTEIWLYFIHGAKTGTFNNEGKAIHDHVETSVINLGEKKFGKHPTQKPVQLMEHFVGLLSNPGDLVIDPFMGSGSTGVAAVGLRRKFLGIELDRTYLKLATNRIQNRIKEIQ
jgi:site-specific DNA-methyltransferase (adenine-specific)/modification methylase